MKTDSLLETLGQAIVVGGPDTDLPGENTLARDYGVSRTTVRAAMQGLVARGLIEIRPAAGARVLDHEHWDWLDEAVLRWACAGGRQDMIHQAGLDARLYIEPAIAGLAAQQAHASDLAVMDDALRTMDAHHQDAQTFHLADMAFHKALAHASHNPILGRLGRAMESVQRTLFEHSYRQNEAEIELTISLHRELLEAIRLRQPEQAETLSRRLITTCHRRLNTHAARPGVAPKAASTSPTGS